MVRKVSDGVVKVLYGVRKLSEDVRKVADCVRNVSDYAINPKKNLLLFGHCQNCIDPPPLCCLGHL